MPGKNTAVFGIYPSRLEMEEAVDRLRRAGFRSTDVSALLQDNQGTKDFAHEKSTKAPEGASVGLIVGVIVGGVLGWMAGIGALTMPRLTTLTAAGPILAALAGIGAFGVLGAIIGALAGLGIPEYEARRYAGRIRNGGVLVSVHCDSHEWVRKAKEVMEHAGGQKIAAEAEKPGDFSNADKPLPRARATGPVPPLPDDEEYAERTARNYDRPARTRGDSDFDDEVK